MWSLLSLCEFHHLGCGLDKRKNEWLALNQATDEELARYPKTDWQQRKKYLNSIYKI
jgi:hypothetical protein